MLHVARANAWHGGMVACSHLGNAFCDCSAISYAVPIGPPPLVAVPCEHPLAAGNLVGYIKTVPAATPATWATGTNDHGAPDYIANLTDAGVITIYSSGGSNLLWAGPTFAFPPTPPPRPPRPPSPPATVVPSEQGVGAAGAGLSGH